MNFVLWVYSRRVSHNPLRKEKGYYPSLLFLVSSPTLPRMSLGIMVLRVLEPHQWFGESQKVGTESLSLFLSVG